MPTFRALATYADGTPGATDRLLFETSGGLPRGIAPGSLPFAADDHEHTLADISDAGALASLDDITPTQIDSTAYASEAEAEAGTENTKIMTALRTAQAIAELAGGGTDDQTAAEVPFTPAGNIEATDVQAAIEELDGEKVDEAGAEAAAASYIDGLSGTHDATTVLLGNNTFGAPPGGGGGGLTTELNAGTAITVGSATDSEHHVLTSDSAITLTLDAQATVGMESAFTRAGAGAVSVAVESGAGYWVPSDDIGGSPATAGFTLTGYGYFICIRNSDGDSAEWLFVGQSTLPAAITGNLVASNSAEIYGALSPWQTATGSMASAASARSWNITGNLTAVPITNGWWGKFRNVSGSNKTIALASGAFVSMADGSTGTTLTLADDRGCLLHNDGTNSMVDGVVALA